ncbi:MAG: LysM peptidoglycan-binding domain-containing protein [Tyzzerella sp.]|nr:LysM peptidoglycan-binding domain-containing protein [Tyzzerella sp.]
MGDIVSSQQGEDKDTTEDTQEGDAQEEDTQENDAQEGDVPEGNAQEGEVQEGDTQEEANTVQDSTQQEQPPETTTTKTYIVKEGDTLENISKKEYGDITHIEAICKLNKLEDGNLIFIGQKLLLP